MSFESLLFRPASFFEPLRLEALFSNAQPLEVELGSGDSTFIVEWARRHPERNFLGIERLAGRLRKLDRKGRRAGLMNLRGLRIEAGYALEYLLPAGRLAALHVYFPDPWPKRRHWDRRLVNTRFVELAARALEPGGLVHLRTDHADYFQQMQKVFAPPLKFKAVPTPDALAAVLTDFERDFLAQGRTTHRQSFERLSD